MQKKIENYIHHYLGCGVTVLNPITKEWSKVRRLCFTDCNLIVNYSRDAKLILRPLSDMTENEAIEYFNLHETTIIIKKEILKKGVGFQYKWKSERGNLEDGFSYSGVGIAFSDKNKYNSTEFVYLLSKGFDLFGLIEAGFAIDRSKLN